MDNIYKVMIEDSPIPYLNIKVSENKMGEYTSLVIRSYNKAYEDMFIKNKNYNKEIYIETPSSDYDKKEWKRIFDKVKKNKKYTVERYIETIKEYVSATIFLSGENEFYVRLAKISSQHIKLSQALKYSPFSAWIKDREGRYIDINNKHLQFMGGSMMILLEKKIIIYLIIIICNL